MTEQSQVPSGAEQPRAETQPAPADAEEPTAQTAPSGATDIERLLDEERQKADRYLSNWRRAEADLVNYRRRVEQEKAEITKYSNASLLKKLLPVLDDLDRALNSVPPEAVATSWVEGLRLAQRKFLGGLESEGVTPIDPVGQPFDPRHQEAVLHEPGPEGIVTAVFQKGYRYGDRVLRPALVKVGSGESSAGGPTADGVARSE